MIGAARLTILCATVLVAACSATPLESVPDESGGRGYRVGMTLALVADRMLEKPLGTLSPAPPNLVHESLRITERRVTIDDYRRSRAAFPDILGIVPAGTQIVVTAIARKTTPGLDDWYEVTARFASGPFKGREVSLDRVSARGADGRKPLVDPGELTISE